jgi:hypothetical protein
LLSESLPTSATLCVMAFETQLSYSPRRPMTRLSSELQTFCAALSRVQLDDAGLGVEVEIAVLDDDRGDPGIDAGGGGGDAGQRESGGERK